jgi:signal peptidase I
MAKADKLVLEKPASAEVEPPAPADVVEPKSTPAKDDRAEETPFEAAASICSVLVIGLFLLTFLGQNFVIPSGSMEKTLLVGDHLLVDRITLAPPSKWMPLMHYREPKHGDVIVFLKPVPDPDAEGRPVYNFLVKRLIGLPGDHVHLRDGTVYVNGVAQNEPYAKLWPDDYYRAYTDDFPAVPTSQADSEVTAEWAVQLPTLIQGGDMVVPQGMYFMMGDHRHNSLDSRFWGLVPRGNIIGRPLFNYWSFKTPDEQMNRTGIGERISWMGHVVIHFFSDTRWSRTLHLVK